MPELWDTQEKSAKMLNYCMLQLYMNQNAKEKYKQINGVYPKDKKLDLYADIRRMCPDLQSRTCSEIVRRAELRWQTDMVDCFYKMKKKLPTYKKTCPILLGGKVQYGIQEEGRWHS